MSAGASRQPATATVALKRATPEHVLHRLEWQVIRRLDGLLQGDYRTLFYGIGIDFADLREYQPSDDVRYIDWNVTARMNSPYVRQYVEDREITTWFLLDVSQSMHFGPPGHTKEVRLTELAATFARLLIRNGNRVGAIIYDQGIKRTIPPRSGRNQVLRLIHDLQRSSERHDRSETDLSVLIHAALSIIKRRSLVFLVSDFFSEPGWERPLTLLSRRNELVAIRLRDPREVELPEVGMIVVEDAETGAQLYVDTSDPTFRRRFIEATDRHETTLSANLKRAGVDLFTVATDEALTAAILRMAAQRKKRAR